VTRGYHIVHPGGLTYSVWDGKDQPIGNFATKEEAEAECFRRNYGQEPPRSTFEEPIVQGPFRRVDE
jgi:hypothetical protein